MINPHPPLTGFPIVIASLLLVLEAIGFLGVVKNHFVVRNFLLIALLITTPLTFFSGYFGAEVARTISNTNQDIIGYHQAYGRATLLALVPLLLFGAADFVTSYNKSSVRVGFITFMCLFWLITGYTSYLGGELVFRYGAAVQNQ